MAMNKTGWPLPARQHGSMARYARRSIDGSQEQSSASHSIAVGVIIASAVSGALLLGLILAEVVKLLR